MTVALVVIGGSVGAGLRFLVSEWVTLRGRTELPWGTATVNLLGAGALGVTVGMGISGELFAVTAGLLSGFTTYSTWTVESVMLWSEGRRGHLRGAVNLVGLLVVGLGCAAGGLALGRWIG
jgi:CrcB protein